MGDPIHIPLSEHDRLAGPPLVDFLREEQGHFVVTFVPSDDVSSEPTLTVVVDKQSIEGRRITTFMGAIQKLCGDRVTLTSHLGGRNYTLHLSQGRVVALDGLDNSSAMALFDRLQQIAQEAEIAHRISNAPAQRWRPAV